MTKEFWDHVLAVCRNITRHVGDRLLADFGQAQAVCKADGSLVTASDQWADRTLRDSLQSEFPSHGVLSEEGSQVFPDQEWCWVVDPLDGTTNFTRGLPIWGISLALLYRGTPVFGYVAMPPLYQSFYGYWYGNAGLTGPTGAFREVGEHIQAIHTSGDQASANHFFNLCTRSTNILQKTMPCKVRMLGVTTYNLLTVSMGAALGGVEATPKIWDISAVWAIVHAAGGVWVALQTEPIFPLQVGQDYSRQPYPTLVVAHPQLEPVFTPLVKRIVTV